MVVVEKINFTSLNECYFLVSHANFCKLDEVNVKQGMCRCAPKMCARNSPVTWILRSLGLHSKLLRDKVFVLHVILSLNGWLRLAHINYNNSSIDFWVSNLLNECILLRDHQLSCSGLDISKPNCIICSWIGHFDCLHSFLFTFTMLNLYYLLSTTAVVWRNK